MRTATRSRENAIVAFTDRTQSQLILVLSGGGRKICSVLSLSSQNNTEVFKAPNLFSFLQSRRAWGCTYTCITYTQLLLFLLKQILAPTALLFFPYIGGDKKNKLNPFIYAKKTKIKCTNERSNGIRILLFKAFQPLEKRQKTLKSNERKTIRETCKMKKAICAQFKVYERNFTFTVVISPWPDSMPLYWKRSSFLLADSIQPFLLKPIWHRTRAITQPLL